MYKGIAFKWLNFSFGNKKWNSVMLVKWKLILLSLNPPNILHIPGPVAILRTTKGDNYCSCSFTNQVQTWLLDSLDHEVECALQLSPPWGGFSWLYSSTTTYQASSHLSGWFVTSRFAPVSDSLLRKRSAVMTCACTSNQHLYLHTHTHIQGVPGWMCQTSGGCF